MSEFAAAGFYYGSRSWFIALGLLLIVGFLWKLLTTHDRDDD